MRGSRSSRRPQSAKIRRGSTRDEARTKIHRRFQVVAHYLPAKQSGTHKMYEDLTPAETINDSLPSVSSGNGKATFAQPPAKTTASSSTTPINPAPATSLAAKLRKKRAAAQETQQSQGRDQRHQTVVPVRTPDRQWWFRCHRDPAMSVPVDLLVVRSGPDEGMYFLDPDIEFPDELDQYIVPALLTRSITHDGVEFFFLAKQSAKSPKQSTRRCVNEARNSWIQMKWNPTTKAYDFQYARQLRRDPEWSDKSLDELLEMAFGDSFITRVDHEVITRLICPDDDDFSGTGPDEVN